MGEENIGQCSIRMEQAEEFGELRYVHSYEKRWHDYFAALSSGLPLLREFAFGSNSWYDGIPFEKEGAITTGLGVERYMSCDDGIGPSPYWEDTKIDCDDKDRDALRALFRKIGQEVAENGQGGPYGCNKIEDLIVQDHRRPRAPVPWLNDGSKS
jgi:hypothetical protein